MSKGDELKAAGKQLFIDTYLEFYRGEVIANVKRAVAPFSPDDIREFVAEGKAPPLPPPAIKALSGYEDYLEALKPEELFEWLAEARPDLAETLMSLGDQGAEYIVRLRQFLVDSIRNPEEAPVKQPESQMVELTCDACGAKWTLPRNLAEKVRMCPFCGVSREEEPEESGDEE